MEKLDPKCIEDIIALTPLQEGMLFHYLKDPQSGLYFEQLSLEIFGPLDGQVFEKAWNTVVETNEMLRTVFRWEKLEKPSQIILKEHTCHVIFYDLSDKDSGPKKTALEEIKNRRGAFDLRLVPFRVFLCKLDEKKYEMVISNHHILYDGWSNGIILKEFFRYYHELSKGEQSLQPRAKTPFKEFVKWVQNQDRNKQERFWKDYLAGFETTTGLPSKRRTEETTGSGDYAIILAEDIKNKLDVFIKNNRVTLASFFYTAWGALLQKYCGSEDIVFGTTVSGRSGGIIKGIEDMVGLFINTIPLRIQTAPGEKIGDMLFRTDQVLREREAFENTPLVDIGSYGPVETNGPLFDTIVAIENYPLDKRLLPGGSLLSIHSFSMVEATHYDLSVGIAPFNEIEINFSYKPECFDKDDIKNLAGHFKRIIQNMIETPEAAVSQLEMISIEEKNRVLYEFNSTAAEYPKDKTIHRLFEEQVDLTPDHIAVFGHGPTPVKEEEKIKDGHLSYRELTEQSDRLAGFLIAKGVLADTIVGIMMEHSVEMIVGILGILKSGGAYLPIDPAYPQVRIDYMLKDSGAHLLVTSYNKESDKVRRWEDEKVLLKSIIHHSSHPSHLAYLIYTSGSTGKPKGVMVEHRSLVNLCFWHNSYYSVTSWDRATKYAGFGFDASVWEIFPYLAAGASLYIVPGEIILDIAGLNYYFEKNGITVSFLPTQMCEQFLALRNTSLRALLTGGDRLRNYIKKNYRLYNNYGPTEATVVTTSFCVTGEFVNIPIGTPIYNNRVYIVDRYHRLQPIGVPGEILVGGDGVARGYLNNPELTAEKFEFNRSDRSYKTNIFYKTGDLARWLTDGNIEFLGRIDQQVKIRGFRIEIGEIETQLLKHPDVNEAVVVKTGKTGTGDYSLCAYIVAHTAQSGLSDRLREFLSLSLPYYMIPAYFVLLENIPLTPNGKLDARALPEPETTPEENPVMPESEIEMKLATIWGEILGIDHNKIGIDSNFFRLGGHSLKITRLASGIHRKLDLPISLTQLFKLPTIRAQARYLQEMAQRQTQKMEYIPLQPLQPAPIQEYYDLSYAQRRLWIICQFEEDSIAYNEVGGLTINGKFNPTAFEQAIRAMAQRHESLRTVFVIIDGEPKQKILPHVEFGLLQEDLRHLKGDRLKNTAAEIIKNTANKAFNLEKAPLAVFKLLHLEEEQYFLLVNIHHIINDGWSVGVLKKEISILYSFFNKGLSTIGEIPLEPVTFQYKDYTIWHNRLITGGYFDKFKDYWLEKLKDKPTGIELPLDHPRGAVQTFNGGRIYYRVEEVETAALRNMCSGENATLFMKLMTLLSILLHKYSGENDIMMGSPIAGRKQPELHHMIGFLVNTLVYRLQVEPGASFQQLLAKMKEETLACYENQDYPFDILVDNLGLARDMSRSPLFNIMMSYADDDTNDENIKFDWAEVAFHDQVEGFNPSVFDLVFFFTGKETRFDCEIMYNSDLFERRTIQRMAANFLTLVKNVLGNINKPIFELGYIEKEEYQTIVHHFNDNSEEFMPVTIQQLVEKQAQKSLNSVAVVSPEGWSITYDELNKKANRVAHYLQQEYAIGPGKVIGICIERSIEMIIAVLGVVKSGAAYLSFDPNYPRDRVEHMIKDSRAQLVIIDQSRPDLFDNNEENTQMLLDIYQHWPTMMDRCFENLEIKNELSDPVYVIYTSGSTGTPNGAMLSQALLSNLIQWQAKDTDIDGSLRCLQFTSINFCVSFQEIFTTLSSGGQVHLIGDIERQDITYLMEFLVRRKIGNLYLPFSYLNFLFNLSSEAANSTAPAHTYLQHIITAGEQLKITGGLKKFLEQNPGIKLHNHYGSSEMHVVTSFTLDAAAASLLPVPPAGKPIANTRIYILDENGKAVPIGVWGELFVDGSSEVLGYIHNPVLTDKKLVWNREFSPFSGHRLYRSGDVGRWLPNGDIELKGRKDFQVKIRGFRVELSEIESKILAFEKIKDCVVVVKENPHGGEKTLVAYVVARELDVIEIKRRLGSYLPQYMIPKFVVLESLPLMPNGKVDRDRLPTLTTGSTAGEDMLPEVPPGRIDELLAERSTSKPQTGLERMIAGLTRFLVGRVLPDRARISHVDIDIFRGEESRLGLETTDCRFFEEQAARTPDTVAVVGMDFAISYQELNRRADRLASLLRKKGVSTGSAVGLMLAPSAEMIVGLLGILKAGGAYLPIAPDASTDAIITMLEEHRAQLLLTSGKDLGKHPFALLQGVDIIAQPPLVTAPRPQIMNFDGLPIPDRSLVSYEKYNRHIGLGMVKNTITLQATRGCPYNCLYCHKIWPKTHVYRSAENIFQEVDHYYRLGVRRFVFADDIFNLDNRNSRRFFELVVKNKLDIHIFFPNGLRSDLLTPDYMDLMVEAGLAGLGMALETASPRLQKLIRKHLHLDKLRENIEYFCRHHPQVILELFTMHGFPTESEDEALMTFDFVKSRHWIDFPYLLILKIYPNTDMAALAVEKGIPREAITRSAHMAYHELPDTLPFDKGFTLKYQSDFANEYFLLKERLLAKMPYQMRVMTPDEMVEKYNSYLPVEIKTFAGMLDFLKLRPEELGLQLDKNGSPLPETYPPVRQGIKPQNLDAGIGQLFAPQNYGPSPDALRILLLDLSQFFSHEREMLYDGVEPPLGLMALLTYLKRELGNRVNGRIAKSRVDFDHYDELKALIKEFKPQVIGIRTLSHHRDFFHKTLTLVRQWGVDVPIIAGGPYATSDCAAILQSRQVDLVVLSEGELTFTELIKEMIKTNGQLPGPEVLEKIQGIAFIPQSRRGVVSTCRDIVLMDGLDDAWAGESDMDPEPVDGHRDPALPAHDTNGTFKHSKPVVSWVFDGSAYQVFQVFNALAHGGSLSVAPEVVSGLIGKGEVALMEFYRSKDSNTSEPAFDIRLELRENSPLIKKQRFDNDVEEKLAEIWSELLGVDKNMIGRDDSFFELGGHSLKAATLITRIHKNFNSSIKLIEIFKAPTLRGIGELIRTTATAADAFKVISPVETREYYPLSAAQNRMYILQMMDVESTAYNMPRVMELEGDVDKERLEKAVKLLIKRHEAFRTSFEIQDNTPVQRIHSQVEFKIDKSFAELFQKRPLGEPPEAIIKSFIRSFDLSWAPLLRVGLLKLREGGHLLMVDMHHIISDGVSIEIMIKDFMALYNGEELPKVGLTYKDYAEWQRGTALREVLNRQESYWLQEFQGEIPILKLPTDYKRPIIQSFAGRTLNFEISEGETQDVRGLTLAEGGTLFIVLLTVYNIFLAKISGQEEIIIGSPVAGRRHADLGNIIGMFVNTLALQNAPVGEKNVREFLREVKEKSIDAFANQDYPYEELVGRLQVDRDTGRNPLFDTMFAHQNIDIPEIYIPDLKLKPYPYEQNIAKFDLYLQCIENGENLSFTFEYCTELFREDTVKRFAGYFKKILASFLERPNGRISAIEIISEEEKERLLFQFNDTAAAYPHDKVIHQLFMEQASRTPGKIAIVGTAEVEKKKFGVMHLTYKELNEQSDQLAGLLVEKGVLADNIVGIMMGRSVEMIIGIMGILKAGGAYLPIDPEYPQERIGYLLKDSGAKLLVTTNNLVKESEKVLLEFIILYSNHLSFHHSPFIIHHPSHLAYLIYTSGSTGKPKGAVIEHHSLVNRLIWMQKKYPLNENDTILQKNTFTFDVSVWEIFWWSIVGAQLCQLVPGGEKDPELIAQAIERNHIATMHFVPSMLSVFLDYLKGSGQVKKLSGLKQVITSGEALLPVHVDRFNELLNKSNSTVLANLYGPTEATIDVSYFDCLEVRKGEIIPIGKPIDNIRLYILDKHLHILPIGIPGELCISGIGLARGYLNRPALTAEKFKRDVIRHSSLAISSPSNLSNDPWSMTNGRFYETGDLARWLDDGNIEFLGRIDHQVKIRGFRVELGEIENQLLKHDQVKEIVVALKGDETGDKNLTAYFVSNIGLSDVELREHLAKDLPDYMIPSYFVRVEKIPLTPNGKLDRKALPEPELKGEAYVAPRNEIEKKLVEIWTGVLSKSLLHHRIGIDDNFFRLGGHSLKATSLASRISKEFNVKIPLGEIFKRPTIRGFFYYINGAVGERFIPIEAVEEKEYYILSSAQKRLYFLQQMDNAGTTYNISAAWIMEGVIDKPVLEQSIAKLIHRHESLRTSFVSIGEEPVQRIHVDVPFEIEYFDLAVKDVKDGEDVHHSSFIIHHFIRPFDLTNAPLIRVGLAKIEEEKHIFLVDMHHIISDGMSTQVLVQDFSTLYSGKEMPEMKIKYKDYAEWQNREKVSKKLGEQSEYWKKEYEGEIPVLELPTDYARHAVQNFEGDRITFGINSETSGSLKALAVDSGATLYMVLLALYTIFLSKLSNQEDIIIGSPLAGRSHADLEKIIGMFVNTLALRNYPAGEKKFTDFLEEVKGKTLNAFDNQEYQYEDLVENVAVTRDLSRNPLFDTMLVLQNFQLKKLEIPGLKLIPYEYENKTTKFDLTLTVMEVEEKLLFTFEYSTKLFREENIKRFTRYFKNILRGIIKNKDRRISNFEIITEEEKKRILFDFNDTEREYPGDKTIHQLFEEQSARTPNHIAIVGADLRVCLDVFGHGQARTNEEEKIEEETFGGVHLSYRQLNEQVGRLAWLLIERGVLAGDIVGIMMERCVEMVIGILGILKSGGAYLPIDPEYPRERIEYMLKDSSAKLLITTNDKEGEKVRRWEGEKVLLESIIYHSNHHSFHHSSFIIHHPGNLAYIMYTSGTTGKPKGVMVTHKNVVRLVMNTNYIDLSGENRILQTGAPVFDAATFEIWGALLQGGELVLVGNDIILDADKLGNALTRYRIITLWLTSSLFNQLVEQNNTIFSGLKNLLVGGDVLSPRAINMARSKNTELKIINGYGPTENTTFSTTYPVDEDFLENIPIGKPIHHSMAYILDKHGYQQPVGVVGELYLGGDGVSRGYLNDPELTAEKFGPQITLITQINEIKKTKINKSFAGVQGGLFQKPPLVFYKTGDLARWRPDGNIEFMGRRDNQVKIRGFRIELGEIENLLLRHHDMGGAVVLSREDKTNDHYLCAYIVPRNTGAFDKTGTIFSGLREYLSQSLPEYMIPRYFIELEKIPLNPNGKIDRKSLTELQVSNFEFNKYIAPRDETEEKLTLVWSEVLSVEKEKISIDANFFELGGHSLKATKLVTKVHKEFNIKLPLAEVFRTPTILGLAKYIKGTVAETYLSITPTEKKEYYGLSSAQKRLYLLLQMEPKSTVYNITSAILLEGKLEKKRLEETFKKLIMRHESLRTSFYLIDGIPAQVVHESVDFEPGYYEIEAEDEPAVNAQIENLIRNVTPFDLTKPPLMKVNLIKVAEMKHYLVFDMHHIISDGTSSAIFIKEFTALYDRVELPPLRIRYSDYSEWQNREKEKERIKKQEEYWLKRFEGEVPVLKLPTDFSRPRMQSFEGKRTFFNISEADTAALNRLALEQETTLYTVLLSLYYILLHKLGQQEDIVIGAPTAGRVHADLQDLIGMFLNTLTLRYYPQPGKTFITFLSEVKTGVLDALENQEYQFDELVDKLELKRDTGRNPLFDVMFILQNMEMPEIQISGLKIKSTDYMTGTTKFDLSLYAVESGQVIHFNFNFSTKLFESATIEIFINYFKNIISSVLKNPGINIADIEYVSEKDRADIVKHFNRDLWQEAETVLAGKKVFQEKLNEISAKYPDHTAIEYDRKTLTYSQLDLRSNYVANWIVDQGITKQTFIGILIDERAELITTVLGIIKAGCVFVSLDSSYPDQRLETMMETTGMKIIMVDKTNNHRFAGNETVKKQNVEFRIFETLFLNAHLNPSWFVDKTAVEYDPGDRLYILFTSGTTGKPKAIMGRNSGLLHYISWEIKKFDIKNGFRIGQLAIPSFDPFLRDVFVPLCSGGVVCIPGNKDIVMDSVALRKWLEKVRIQLIHCVPVLFKLINSAPLTAANLKDLKFILLAGEKAVPSVLADWYAIFDERIRLVNLLGPTETTQAKICYLIQKDDIKRVRIPVGKPMEGAAVILLDDRLNVCGLLEKGEICIRTPFRSCGYFGDDELNKRKFIQNPFSDEPGDIVYRTGDMGMFLPDGKLDFVGREDRQVKIRGRRIELEEIENVLLRHPAVREAAITKIETANNDELLCAYVAENAQYAGDEKLFTETLPGYLAERLPDYMVPANMVKIEKIPRNTNGKVDYRKLPDPFAENQKERIAPRDEIEKRILKTWIELLKLETIGVTDNFFNSGGSSLTAISLTHKIHKEFDVHLALEDVFQNPTIEEQAKLIRAAIKEKYTSIEKAPERDYYKLSSAQKRLYIIWSIDPQNTAYNISKAIAIEGELDRDRLDKTFKELTERHESFRTTFLIKDEEPVQEIQKEVTLPIRYTDARGMREEELKEEVDKMIEKFLAPFDLSKAPLLRVELIEIREKKYILLVDMHHIISDGTSLGILIKDFMSLYRGEKLTPLRLQYKDYSEWESRLFESGKMDAQEEFWLKILEEELPVLKLPLDFQRPKISGFRQSTLDFSLGEKLSAKVKQLAGETGATLHILLLAIYNILLAKYSGQEDILVGSGIVGRKHEDLKNIIGMFVNILVMRNRPGEDKTFKKFLEEVRSNAVNTYENQDYPFDRLVMKLGIEREYGRNPVFDTIFQFHNLEMETFDIPGLKLKSYEYKKPFTQFDLSLDGIDNGDMVIMWFSYAVELFKESTVVDLKKHYEEILEQVVENREIKLKDITLSHRLKDGKSDLSKKESMDFGF